LQKTPKDKKLFVSPKEAFISAVSLIQISLMMGYITAL